MSCSKKLITGVIFFIGSLLVMQIVNAKPRDTNHIPEADALSPEDAAQYLATIRSFSYEKDYVFRFKLKHYPPRSRTVTYYGTLYGHSSFITGEHFERIVIESKSKSYSESSDVFADILLKRGTDSKVWVLYKDENQKKLRELSKGQINEPVLSDVTLSYFDLLAPYLYWDQYEYLGPDQIKARPAQSFRFSDYTDDSKVVEVYLDDEFRAVLKTVIKDNTMDKLSTMELVSFKKTFGQYIPKTIDYRNYVKKGHKSRIEIIAAAMEQSLPEALFQPGKMTGKFPALDHFVFDVF